MSRILLISISFLLLAACVRVEGSDAELELDVNANADGDCMTDLEEVELGTDPEKEDTDGDGFSDCEELDAVSDPSDADEVPYTCGWAHNNPGNIQPTGAAIGDVMYEASLPDQCGEEVNLWDFHGKYHVIYMTAAW